MLRFLFTTTLFLTLTPALCWAQGTLENPGSGSSQSGVGIFSGWHCNATRIEIQVDAFPPTLAAYGTPRGDTQGVCGDTNNGFGLLTNWSLFGDGPHTVRALADGVQFGVATFTVTTLGTQFLQGAGSTTTATINGRQVTLRWVEAQQNFVIVGVSGPYTPYGPPGTVLSGGD